MRNPHLLLCAALALAAAPAEAGTLMVDGTSFAVELPSDYCALNLELPAEAHLFDEAAVRVAERGLRLVAGFNRCSEGALLALQDERDSPPDGMISVLLDRDGTVARLEFTRTYFLHRIKQRQTMVDWDAAQPDLDAMVSGAPSGEGPRLVRLGVIGQDDDAVYVGTAVRSEGKSYANLVAFTMSERIAFQVSMTDTFEDRASFERLLADEEAVVRSLVH
jgi:hypothetical protein